MPPAEGTSQQAVLSASVDTMKETCQGRKDRGFGESSWSLASRKLWGQMWWHALFIPALGSQEQADLCLFEGRLLYIVSFRQWLHSETWAKERKSESWGWGCSSVGRMFAWYVQSPGINSQHYKKPGVLPHTWSSVFWILTTWGIQGLPEIPATCLEKN